MSIIQDGAGTGNSAQVTSDNHLKVSARTVTSLEQAIHDGNAFNINTGNITLTSANESAVLYVKNTSSDRTLENTAVVYLLGNSNISGVDWLLKTYRNPTTGTVITTVNAGESHNRNFGSSKTLEATINVGAEARTITASDGVAIQTLTPGNGRIFVGVPIFLPPGASVGISIEPPTGNTSCVVQAAFNVALTGKSSF